ncbi:MAG: prepilin-type N-terminal cleavage/methylation domain-containing protein [Nitrospira sp.]|nr:prepilin-type N-terminal cleavage/methylation domain-containing protein [Nitrospira sp.]
MAPNIRIGRACSADEGFTLVELMIVVAIVGILATISIPSYHTSLIKARETVLRQDLFTMREVLDQHRADQGKYPSSLGALVAAGYLRMVPKDPFTNSTNTWQEISDSTEGGVFDVYSGSDLVGTNGTAYNQW